MPQAETAAPAILSPTSADRTQFCVDVWGAFCNDRGRNQAEVRGRPAGDWHPNGGREARTPKGNWRMLVDDAGVLRTLRQVVSHLTRDWALRQDLLQEALVYLWQQETSRPEECRSWYLQSCRFHLQNFLRHGRSIDSPGRRYQGASAYAGDGYLPEKALEPDEMVEEAGAEESVFWQVSAQDIVQSLSQRLAAREQTTLSCLANGQGPREIARALGVSHTSVIKQRQKIAALAVKLGIPPPPRKPPATRKAKRVRQRRLATKV
jgi:DNA-directed RNA polymerase specialized sigma24 family protein